MTIMSKVIWQTRSGTNQYRIVRDNEGSYAIETREVRYTDIKNEWVLFDDPCDVGDGSIGALAGAVVFLAGRIDELEERIGDQ